MFSFFYFYSDHRTDTDISRSNPLHPGWNSSGTIFSSFPMIKKLISAGFWYGSLSVVVYHLACVQMDFANLQLPLCTYRRTYVCVCVWGGSVLCEQEGHWRRREQSRGENKNNQGHVKQSVCFRKGISQDRNWTNEPAG